MNYIVAAGVCLLAFANGANDNFKGVATVWGTGRYSYRTVLLWGTVWTFAGSIAAFALAGRLIRLFDGSAWLGQAAEPGGAFLAAVALGTAVTVLMATRIGAPVSTTHALIGALAGAGLLSAGAAQVRWTVIAHSILVPLLLSPLVALACTLVAFPAIARWLRYRSCVCLTEPAPTPFGCGEAVPAVRGVVPGLRIAGATECACGDAVTRWNTEELVHWASASLISFSRGLNDTPKIAALVLPAAILSPAASYAVVALIIALGGLAAARRVARTMSQRVTRIEPVAGLGANLVSAVLVAAASRWGLPVSTTHVTMGGIFGVGVQQRRQTDWRLVRQIVLAWVVTLPLGLICGLGFYHLLAR